MVERLRPTAQQREIVFDLRLEPAVVHGSAQVLDEVIFNLCGNAVKYNKGWGQVY